jgi:hypothetical protein
MPSHTHPDFVDGRTTYFRPGGETGTRNRRSIPQSAYRSPFFSSGHDYIQASPSAASLSPSARLVVSLSAATSVASASQDPLASFGTIDDQVNDTLGGSVYGPDQVHNLRSERSRGTFSGGGVDSRAIPSTRVDSTTTFQAYPSGGHGCNKYEDDDSLHGSRSASKKSQCMSVLRKCRTGVETLWTRATGTRQGEEESRVEHSRSRLSIWKAYQSRNRKSTAPTTSRFGLRKRLKSRW